MKALFNYIKTRINTDIPSVKTVRMWNKQLDHSNGEKTEGRNEKTFPYPAIFVEFIVNQVDNRAMGIKDYILTVRFRYARTKQTFERLDMFDLLDQFDSFIQLMAPTTPSGLTFTTFQEETTNFDTDFNNVEAPYRDFRTRYRSSAAYQRVTDIQVSGIGTKIAFAGTFNIDFSNPYNSQFVAAMSGI